MINEAIKLYQKAGACTSCFDLEIGKLPNKSGCRLPQPRWIGSKYWDSEERILVCMMNPGSGNRIEHEYEQLLQDFYAGKILFAQVNGYFKIAMKYWGGGQYQRQIVTHLGCDLEKTAIMNIALCPMVNTNEQDVYPSTALENCFKRHTLKIMRALQPHKVVLSGSSIHRFKGRIEDSVGAKVVLAPHYAARLRLSQLQETYASIRNQIHGNLLTSK